MEIHADIPAESLATYREEALKELQKTAKIDGFRPGHAPADRIVQLYGEPALLRLAAERAIQQELPELMAKEQVLIVETPRVQTETPEIGKPLSFTARAGIAPEVKLPDWKAIAKKHNAKKEPTTISDTEHQDALTHIRRERARIEKMETGMEAQAAMEAAKAIAEHELPPLDDTFVQSIGYESAEKFSDMVRTNMQSEKESQEKQTRRSAILDELARESTIHYPAILREYELNDMEARLADDLSRMGANLERYLTELKKTREELRIEWKDAADKRAKVRLVLSELARAEKIEVEETLLAQEIERARKIYPQADEANIRAGITHAIRNEKVMELLEQQ